MKRVMRLLSTFSTLSTLPAVTTVALILLSPAAVSQGVPDDEFQINVHTPSAQWRPEVVPANGKFIVVWQSEQQDGDGGGIFARWVDSSGQTLGEELQVNSYTTGNQGYPAVATVAYQPPGFTEGVSDRFVVVWSGAGPGDDAGVFARLFESTGEPLGPEFLVNTETTGVQERPHVDADEAGNFMVGWHDDPEWRIGLQRFDNTGALLGVPLEIAGNEPGKFNDLVYSNPQILAREPGEFVVAWRRFSANGYYPDFDFTNIRTAHFDADGNLDGDLFVGRVSGYDTGMTAHSIASTPTGFVVVWDETYGYNAGSIHGRAFDDATGLYESEVEVTVRDAEDEFDPSVAADPGGRFLVVFEGQRSSDPDGVFGNFFRPGFVPESGDFLLNEFTTNVQRNPAVAADPTSGSFLVVWDSQNQDGSGTGIFGRMTGFFVFADGFEAGDTSAWSATVSPAGPP
jgi:hypothetical protein